MKKLVAAVMILGSLSTAGAMEHDLTLSGLRKNPEALVVVEQAAGLLSSYDPVTGEKLGSVPVGFNPHEVEVSPDGRLAFVSNFGIQDYDETIGKPGKSISIVDLVAMKEIGKLGTGVYAAPHGVKLRPPLFNELYVNVEQGHALLAFDTKNGKILRRFPVQPGTHNFLFSNDGQSIWLMSGAQGVVRIDADTGREIGRLKLNSPVRGLSYSPDRKFLLLAGQDELGIFDARTHRQIKRFQHFGVGQILYAVFTTDGSKIIAPAVWDSQVLVIDAGNGEVLERIVTGLDPVAVAVTDDGSRAFVSNARSRHVSCIDLKKYTHEKCVTATGPNGLAFGNRPDKARSLSKRTKLPTLLFGAPLPLSGRESYFGRELMLGYEFWKETVNAEGGLSIGGQNYSVEISYQDTQSDVRRVGPLSKSLILSGVRFLLGTYNSPANAELAEIARLYKIPLVTSTGAAREIYEQGNTWVFGIMAPATEYLKGSLEFGAQIWTGVRTIAIVARNAPAPLEDARTANEYAIDLGLTVPYPISVFQSADDFSNLVSRLKVDTPDFILFAGDLSDAEAFVKEAAMRQLKPMGYTFSVGPSLPRFSSSQGVGKLASYLIGSSQWSSEADIRSNDRFKNSKNFARLFWDRYYTPADYLSAGAVASGQSFEDALKRAGNLSAANVQNKLRTQAVRSFYGLLRFNRQGLNVTKPIYTIQLQPQRTTKMKDVILHPGSSGEVVWPFPGFKY